MKILFTKLPETSGLIEVSFNGGESYIPYEIDAIRENGIHLDDNQDYSKIQIKGKSGILKNLDIVKNINIEKENAFQIYKTVKVPIFEEGENATEPAFLCYVNDSDGDNIITDNDDTKTTYAHRVVYLEAGTTDKFYIPKDAKLEDIQPLVLASSVEDLKPVEGDLYRLLDNDTIVEWDSENNKPYDDYINKRIRYPEGDLSIKKIVGYSEETQLVETVTEIIPSDVLEITYNNTGKQIIVQSDTYYQAEPGKAIKSLHVVLKPAGLIKEPPSEAVMK